MVDCNWAHVRMHAPSTSTCDGADRESASRTNQLNLAERHTYTYRHTRNITAADVELALSLSLISIHVREVTQSVDLAELILDA